MPILMPMESPAYSGSRNEWSHDYEKHRSEKNDENTREFQVPPPPLSEDYFPCSMCHEDMETDRTKRRLTEEHTDIRFDHDSENRWCLDCHDENNRDMLHLASGALLDFSKSYLLCGQCHGPKIRDWKAGIHGKLTGEWNGEKQYLVCAHCHDPHSPRYKPVKPEPAPVRPENIIE